jgi:hypothetical protein
VWGRGKALWKQIYWDLPSISPIWGKRVPTGSRASKVVMAGLSRGNGTIGSNRGAWLTKSATAVVVVFSRLLGCSRSRPVRFPVSLEELVWELGGGNDRVAVAIARMHRAGDA